MQYINIDKQRLVETLTENKAKHRDIFLEAQEGYRKKVIEELDKSLKLARDGKRYRTHIPLSEPHDYTDEYSNSIIAA